MTAADKAAAALTTLVDGLKGRMPPIFASSKWTDPFWRIEMPRQAHVRGGANSRLTFAPELKEEPFAQPYADFAKMICCRLALRQPDMRSESPLRHTLVVLRLLHRTLVPSISPADLRGQHFNDAEAALDVYDEEVAGRLAGRLQWIADLIAEEGLAGVAFKWRRSIGKGDVSHPDRQRRSGEGQLLDEEAMYAWATLSADPPAEILEHIKQRVVDLMVCGGFRLGEACTLPADTLEREIAREMDGSIIRDADGSARTYLGLRYWPEKSLGSQTLVKAVPTAMVPIAERAVAELLELTAKWRAVALAHARGRSPFGGTPLDDMAEDEELNGIDIAKALGRPTQRGSYKTSDGRDFVRLNGVPHREGVFVDGLNKTRPTVYVKKRDFEVALRKRTHLANCLPREDVFVGLHECLVLAPVGAGSGHSGCEFTMRPLKGEEIYVYLRARLRMGLRCFRCRDSSLRCGPQQTVAGWPRSPRKPGVIRPTSQMRSGRGFARSCQNRRSAGVSPRPISARS